MNREYQDGRFQNTAKFELEDAPFRHYQHLDWDSRRWDGFKSRPGDVYVCRGLTW